MHIFQFTTNTFTLTSPSLTPIGVCVSPTMALLNHSCDPNAVMVFPHSLDTASNDEPRMHLVSIRDISPGEQVFVSYIDTSLPRELRQKELKEVYNFQCHCNACTNEFKLDLRACVCCPVSCGGLCPLPTEGTFSDQFVLLILSDRSLLKRTFQSSVGSAIRP